MGILRQLFFPEALQTAPEMPAITTVMTPVNIADIRAGRFHRIPVRKLILKNGENCYFCDYSVQITERFCTIGRHRDGFGASIRILKGLTWHNGTHDTQQIWDTVQEYTCGKMYITDKRIIFSADAKAFQKDLSSLISYRTEGNDLILQFTNTSYRIYLPVADCAEKTLEYVL